MKQRRGIRWVLQWDWKQWSFGFNLDFRVYECVFGFGPLVMGWEWKH